MATPNYSGQPLVGHPGNTWQEGQTRANEILFAKAGSQIPMDPVNKYGQIMNANPLWTGYPDRSVPTFTANRTICIHTRYGQEYCFLVPDSTTFTQYKTKTLDTAPAEYGTVTVESVTFIKDDNVTHATDLLALTMNPAY